MSTLSYHHSALPHLRCHSSKELHLSISTAATSRISLEITTYTTALTIAKILATQRTVGLPIHIITPPIGNNYDVRSHSGPAYSGAFVTQRGQGTEVSSQPRSDRSVSARDVHVALAQVRLSRQERRNTRGNIRMHSPSTPRLCDHPFPHHSHKHHQQARTRGSLLPRNRLFCTSSQSPSTPFPRHNHEHRLHHPISPNPRIRSRDVLLIPRRVKHQYLLNQPPHGP
ncbi:hypothetical protein FPV67DRAFT_115469 [Lyophyllum atratum]|nr:hypothetical protein FPV67DRAFT_115469 [Lyophyllum atratum]